MNKQAALEKINEIITTIDGVVGVAASCLENDLTIMINETALYPTASTIKVPVIYELYRQAELGLVDLSQRIELKPEQRVTGSGVLQDMDFGLNLTVRDLAVLMIVVSDNSATDILIELVGLENIQNTMNDLGLSQTSAVTTIRQLMYYLTGYDINDPNINYEQLYQRLQTTRSDPNGPATAETNNNLSSPADMVKLLTGIFQANDLSRKSCDDILDIMLRQKYNEIIPLYLPMGVRVAHKTGSIGTVRADVGIVYAPNQPYAIALMTKKLTDETDTMRKLARISEIIYNFFTTAED